MIPLVDGGINQPASTLLNSSSAYACASSLMSVKSSAVTTCLEKGSGHFTYGCVGWAYWPGNVLAGTGLSSTSDNTSPVILLNISTLPVFVSCTTPGTDFPSSRSVVKMGAHGRSKAHKSLYIAR